MKEVMIKATWQGEYTIEVDDDVEIKTLDDYLKFEDIYPDYRCELVDWTDPRVVHTR